MLQRIQTVFLLIIAALMTLFLFFPVWIGVYPDGSSSHQIFALFHYQYGPDGQEETVEYLPYAISGILAGLAIVIAVVEAFAYKNRMTQVKLGALNALILGGSLASAIWIANQSMQGWEGIQGQYGIGVFFPVFALICNILANRFIRKDEKLVRSMDRIR